MGALTKNVNCSTLGPEVFAPFSANGADTFWRGAFVYIDTGGGVQSVPAAGDRAVGVSPFKQTTTAPADIVNVMVSGLVWLPLGTNISASDEGEWLMLDISAVQSDNPADMISYADSTPGANDCVLGRILRATSTQMLVAVNPAFTGSLVRADTGTGDNSWI